jgi:ribonuclease HI
VFESNEPVTRCGQHVLGSRQHYLLRLYRSIIRSKLDYGCIVYGSARDSYIKSLDRVQNAALRVCLGAFRTTPISSLHMEANELPAQLRREKLALQYIVKLKSNPNNPAYVSVFQPNFKPLFIAKPNVIATLGIRMEQSLQDIGVDLSCIAQHALPSSPPWLFHRPGFDFTLYNLGTKSNTSPDIYLSRYRELVSMYQGYQQIFTDGSKHRSAVSAGAVTEGKVLALRLPDHSSIFSAEARAVLVGLKIIEQSPEKCFLILSDSLSCLKSLENRNLQNPVVLEIIERVHKLLSSGLKISFVWVPSHIGIAVNTAADATAKAALSLQLCETTVPYSDFKPLVAIYVKGVWQMSWDGENSNKLHCIKPVIGPFAKTSLPRRDEVVIHRLRFGHTHHTHGYLLRKELAPVCDTCHVPLTVEHILLLCSTYAPSRKKFFADCVTLVDLFTTISSHIVISFLKEIDIYCKL